MGASTNWEASEVAASLSAVTWVSEGLVSASVMIWASSLGARGKMGASGPSLVPGLRPPHWRFLSSPFLRGGFFDVAEA